ncbi:radical SAM protein [Actinoplanes sp. NPDC026670]|uniref:radical SAM protein n=1 Tax=Actinoplanes sp. NPDC026670 TaxID=3154700 RepID=UPI0034088A58
MVVKLASRCNLACTYCYMYEHSDQTWRMQPRFMADETMKDVSRRIAEYLADKPNLTLTVVAHGGEPLLLGVPGLRRFFETVRRAAGPRAVRFGIQTNGVLITPDIVDLLIAENVFTSVSLDGQPISNDLRRINKNGTGSAAATMAGVSRLRASSQGARLFTGFLAVIDLDVNPAEALAFFNRLSSPSVDFLLPHYNYDTFPAHQSPLEYGAWLAKLFDLWFDDATEMRIRSFEVIMKLLLGGTYGMDFLGSVSRGVVTIETDGSYHSLDALKTSFSGATATGMTVSETALARVESLPAVSATRDKATAASTTCLTCPVFSVCGGGLLAHRFSAAHGYNRPSVFCKALYGLIRHIERRLGESCKFDGSVTALQ